MTHEFDKEAGIKCRTPSLHYLSAFPAFFSLNFRDAIIHY
jgi:hypothetical protein